MPHPHHHHDPHRPSARDIREAIAPGVVEDLLARWIDDPGHRRFLARCILEEGPAHHRGANFVILALLEHLLRRLKPSPDTEAGPSLRVSLRLPPHLREQAPEGDYPLELPIVALAPIAEPQSAAERAFADCLLDGPPHHALANVAMVRALHDLARALDRRT